MKHTPGPWTIERLKNDAWRIQSHARIICIESFRDTPENCLRYAYGSHPQSDELEANAQLIAAAPALLEACKTI